MRWMKTIICLVGVLCCLYTSSFADGTGKGRRHSCKSGSFVLIYDFKNARFNDADGNRIYNISSIRLERNQLFSVKVINLNRYLYNVSVEVNHISYNPNPNELFNSLFINYPWLIAPKQAFNGSDISTPSIRDGSDESVGQIGNFKDSSEAGRLFNRYQILLKELNTTIFDLQNLIFSAYSLCPKPVNCCRHHEKISSEDILHKIYNLELLKTKIDLLPAMDSPVKESVLALHQKYVDPLEPKDITKLVIFANNLVHENFEYVLPPIFATGDEVTLHIKITPIAGIVGIPLAGAEINETIPVKGRWSTNFSSGPFIGMIDPDYQYHVSDDGNGKFVLHNSGRRPRPIGLSALAHYLPSPGNNASVVAGFCLGAGITADPDAHISFPIMAGGTVSMGRHHKMVLSAGLLMMGVRILDAAYYRNKVFETKPTTLNYKSYTQAGGFISLGYVLFDPSGKSEKKSGGQSNETELLSKIFQEIKSQNQQSAPPSGDEEEASPKKPEKN